MKRSYLFLLALLLAVSRVFGQNATPPTSTTSQPSPDEQTILKLEGELAEVYTSRDAKTLERILADDYTAIWGAGRVFNKQRALRLRLPDDSTMKYQVSEMTAHVWGDAAVATGVLRFLAPGNDNKIDTIYFRVTDTFLKREPNWKLVASHHSVVPWWHIRLPEDKQLVMLAPLDCSRESNMKLIVDSDFQTYVKINNLRNKPIYVLGITDDGKRISDSKRPIKANESNNYYTSMGVVFFITDETDRCLDIYVAGRKPGLIVIK